MTKNIYYLFVFLMIGANMFSCRGNNQTGYYFEIVDENSSIDQSIHEKLISRLNSTIGVTGPEGDVIITSFSDADTKTINRIHFFKSNIDLFKREESFIKLIITFKPSRGDGRPNVNFEFFKVDPSETRRILNSGIYKFPNDDQFQKSTSLYPEDELVTHIIKTIILLSFK